MCEQRINPQCLLCTSIVVVLTAQYTITKEALASNYTYEYSTNRKRTKTRLECVPWRQGVNDSLEFIFDKGLTMRPGMSVQPATSKSQFNLLSNLFVF